MGHCRSSRRLYKTLWTFVLISQIAIPNSLIIPSISHPSTAYASEELIKVSSEFRWSTEDILEGLDLDQYIRTSEFISREEFGKIFESSDIDSELVGLLYDGMKFGSEVYGRLAEKLEESTAFEKPRTDEKFNTDIGKHRVFDIYGGESTYLRNLEEHLDAEREQKEDKKAYDTVDEEEDDKPKIELTQIDGKIAVRLIIENKNIVFVNSDLDSEDFKRVLSKLSLRRDTVVYQFDFTEGLTDLQFQAKPKNMIEWFRVYSKAVYVHPDKGQVFLGAMTGITQAAMTEAAGGSFAYLAGIEANADIHLMAAWSLFWGTTMGTFGRTMKEWHLVQGGPLTKVLKRSSISWIARYAFEASRLFLAVGTGVAEGLFGGEESIHLHLDVALNVFLSNLARSGYYVAPNLHEILSDKSHQKIPVPLSNGKTMGFTYSDLMFQLVYLVPFTISKMDQIFRNTTITYLGTPVSLGKLIIYSGTVVSLVGSVVVLAAAKRALESRIKKHNNPDDKSKLSDLKKYMTRAKAELSALVYKNPANFISKTVPNFLLKTVPKVTVSKAQSCHQVFRSIATTTILF